MCMAFKTQDGDRDLFPHDVESVHHPEVTGRTGTPAARYLGPQAGSLRATGCVRPPAPRLLAN